MTSLSVDDPEKHFLGNLLDEDSISSSINNKLASSEVSSISLPRSSTSAIPHASVISGVGPLNEDVSTFWPEPPPPYSPPKRPAVYWNDAGVASTLKPAADSSLADFLLRSGLKINQRSFGETENDFDSDVSFLKRISQKDPFPTQIHHHHHNLHHHTHMHNVVENHHHYPVPMQPPPGFTNVLPSLGVKPPSPQQAIGKERSEGLRKSPHSAPVVHRMPFSYRDVAARTDGQNAETNVVAQDGKSTSIVDSECSLPRNDQKSASSDCISMCENNSKNSKKELNEFQKISRKKGKEKKAVKDTASLPLMEQKENMPIVNNYQLLNELPASKELLKVPDVASAEDDELDNGVCRPKRLGNSDRRIRNPALSVTNNKKRNLRKKTDLPVWITALLSLFSLLMAKISMIFVFLMTLVVDVCSDSMDVINFGFRCLVNAIMERIKMSANYILMSIYCRLAWIRQMRTSTLFVDAKNFPVVWGCSDIVPIPTTAEEILQRIVHLDHVDAYSVMGMPATCSDEEIRQALFILTSLLAEKYQLEGSAEALRLMSKAADLIGSPELRSVYLPTQEVLSSNDHYVLNNLWELVCRLRKEAKITLFCECGQRHAKIPVDFDPSEARTCRRCSTYHTAKENDIWVESRLFGIVWQYLTYMDGTFYDISEWATCSANSSNLPMLRPYCHSVLYRFDVSRSRADENSDELILESKEVRSGVLAPAVRPMDREDDRSRRAANRRQKRR